MKMKKRGPRRKEVTAEQIVDFIQRCLFVTWGIVLLRFGISKETVRRRLHESGHTLVRRGGDDEFSPVEGCDGNCLACYHTSGKPGCGIEDLKTAGAWKLRDYKGWSKVVEEKRTKQTTLRE